MKIIQVEHGMMTIVIGLIEDSDSEMDFMTNYLSELTPDMPKALGFKVTQMQPGEHPPLIGSTMLYAVNYEPRIKSIEGIRA